MISQTQLNISHAIIICGNDGTGKTSTSAILNNYFLEKQMPYYSFERSTNPENPLLKQLKDLLSPKQIDNTTFIYTFEQRPKLPQKVSFMEKQILVEWIMLDAELETIEKRIHKRNQLTIYQVRKCLEYYKMVYRQMAYYYGIPLIPTDGRSQQQVTKSIIEIIESGRDNQIHSLKLQTLSPHSIETNQLFIRVQQTSKYKVFQVNNEYYRSFQFLVFPKEEAKMLMINRQMLHRNNIQQNVVCINHEGVVLRYRQSPNKFRSQINVLPNISEELSEKLNIGIYEDNIEYPLDKDILTETIDVNKTITFLLRTYCTLRYYCSRAFASFNKLFVKSSNGVLNSFIQKQNITFNEPNLEFVYSKFQKYLLENRFHQTELLSYNVYPYQQIALLLYNNNSSYKQVLKELINETLDVPNSYFCELKSANCWISPNIISCDEQGLLFQKSLQQNQKRTAIINYEKYLKEKQQVKKNDVLLYLEINSKLQSLVEQQYLSSVDILNTLAENGVQKISIKILPEQKNQNLRVSQIAKELMIQMPRRITKVFLINPVSNIDQLQYLWGIKRIIPNISDLNSFEIVREILRFDSKGNIFVRVQNKINNIQDILTVNEKSLQQLFSQKSIQVGQNIYKIVQLLLSDNNRRLNLSIKQKKQRNELPNTIVIGISAGKYHFPLDKFIKEQLGIELVRSQKPRQMLVVHKISNKEKYAKYFGHKEVSFILMKSKDLAYHLEAGIINACVTYSPILDNSRTQVVTLALTPYPNISVGLIKRNNELIDISLWTKESPAKIATQHPNYIRQYLNKQGIEQDVYELHEVVGCSQSFLVGSIQSKFTLCDAVIETGSTMKINDLEVWKIVKQKGSINIGLYQL